jgi:hypothetical protein
MPRASDEDVEEKVNARMERAKLFGSENPPKFWAILDESLIRRPALSDVRLAEQLEHIAQVVRNTHSILQIIPQTSGVHPFMMGMTSFMTFADAPPVVYTESLLFRASTWDAFLSALKD